MFFLRFSLLRNPAAFKSTLIMVAIMFLLMFFVKGVKKAIKKNKKDFLFYVLTSVILFAVTALVTNDKVLNDVPLNKFIALQIIFFILGIVHFFAVRKVFKNFSEKKDQFVDEFTFTIMMACVGLLGFIYIANLYQPAFTMLYLASALWFLVPILTIKCYEFAISIPLPIYKRWFYPFDKRIEDPKEDELINPLVISFEFDRSLKSNETSNFRLKAPEKMEFGKLFYFFINDYNEKHPEHNIEYLSKDKEPYGWIFYRKPKWFRPMKYIDFTRTIDGNNIEEDDVIICKRA